MFVPMDKPVAFFHDVLASYFPTFFLSSKALQKTHAPFSKMGTLMIETGYMHIQATKPDTVGKSSAKHTNMQVP